MESEKHLPTGYKFWYERKKHNNKVKEDEEECDVLLTVIRSYRHHVLCRSAAGYRLSITNADLFLMGLALPKVVPIDMGCNTTRIQQIRQKKLSC